MVCGLCVAVFWNFTLPHLSLLLLFATAKGRRRVGCGLSLCVLALHTTSSPFSHCFFYFLSGKDTRRERGGGRLTQIKNSHLLPVSGFGPQSTLLPIFWSERGIKCSPPFSLCSRHPKTQYHQPKLQWELEENNFTFTVFCWQLKFGILLKLLPLFQKFAKSKFPGFSSLRIFALTQVQILL